MPPQSSSPGTSSAHRELPHRRHKPLAPVPPATKKPSALPATKIAPSSAVTRPPAPPSRSVAGSVPAASPSATPPLKPCTAVLVRTRTDKMVNEKAVVLWLPAVVVSVTDGGYEVVYQGKLPSWDPFATVHVPRDHVRPHKPSATTKTPCAPAAATRTAASSGL